MSSPAPRRFITTIKQPGVSDYIGIMRDPPKVELLQRLCISGDLRTSSVRALVWRMLFKVIPHDMNDWVEVLTRSRESYGALRGKHIRDPRCEDVAMLDPNIHNPLSDCAENQWKRYWDDGETRGLIEKDVIRCFPEMDFFQKENIKKILTTILLVYAKENPHVSYKQGMHEILAPLVFVLYSDQQTYEHYKEMNSLSELTDEERRILEVVYMLENLEHDAYSLFVEVMLEMCSWYEDGASPSTENMTTEVIVSFMRMQDAPPTSLLMEELGRIGEKLREIDFELFKHLYNMDIPPQLYGIRWLRLLFGREFPLHDLLYIWDVLFSQSPLVQVVECLFIAMLIHIKPLLMSVDYSGCLQYLMRYPPISDVVEFTKLVLHLRYPAKYCRPRYGDSLSYSHLTVQGSSHPNQRPAQAIHLPTSNTVINRNERGALKSTKPSIFGRARKKEKGEEMGRESPVKCGEGEGEDCLRERLAEREATMTRVATRLKKLTRATPLPSSVADELEDLACILALPCVDAPALQEMLEVPAAPSPPTNHK